MDIIDVLPYMALGLEQFDVFTTGQEEWQDRLRREWQDTKKMPRKMKKRRRKEITIYAAFAFYEPLEDLKGLL